MVQMVHPRCTQGVPPGLWLLAPTSTFKQQTPRTARTPSFASLVTTGLWISHFAPVFPVGELGITSVYRPGSHYHSPQTRAMLPSLSADGEWRPRGPK